MEFFSAVLNDNNEAYSTLCGPSLTTSPLSVAKSFGKSVITFSKAWRTSPLVMPGSFNCACVVNENRSEAKKKKLKAVACFMDWIFFEFAYKIEKSIVLSIDCCKFIPPLSTYHKE